MFTGNGLGFHPIVRHRIPLADGVCMAPAALALEGQPAEDRSILLGHVPLTE